LLAQSGRIETYGIVMAVYGGANLLGTLFLALLSRLSSHWLFYIGATVQGIGIISMGAGWLMAPGSHLPLAIGGQSLPSAVPFSMSVSPRPFNRDLHWAILPGSLATG
jgi:hypothetical protein